MTTNGYAAKRALFDALGELSRLAGGPLAGVQVAYSYPGQTAEHILVYGGSVTFDQPGEDGDAVDGNRVLTKETAFIGVHIRVGVSPQPDGGIRDTDELAEAIGEAIGHEIAVNPHLCGGNSWARIVGGQGDYSPNDDSSVSTLSYRIAVDSYLEA